MKKTTTITALKDENMFSEISKDIVMTAVLGIIDSCKKGIEKNNTQIAELEQAPAKKKKTSGWRTSMFLSKLHLEQATKNLEAAMSKLENINDVTGSFYLPSLQADDSMSACFSQMRLNEWVDEFVSIWGECPVTIDTDSVWYDVIKVSNEKWSQAEKDYCSKKAEWCAKYGCD